MVLTRSQSQPQNAFIPHRARLIQRSLHQALAFGIFRRRHPFPTNSGDDKIALPSPLTRAVAIKEQSFKAGYSTASFFPVNNFLKLFSCCSPSRFPTHPLKRADNLLTFLSPARSISNFFQLYSHLTPRRSPISSLPRSGP